MTLRIIFLVGIIIMLIAALVNTIATVDTKNTIIRDLAKEIRWQRYRADKSEGRVSRYDELQFVAQIMMANNPDRYDAAVAAWKWGKVYNVSPFLIVSIIHRESNFDPQAVSYVNGSPCAYGMMQVNYAVWKDELSLNLYKLADIDYNIQQGTIILKRYIDAAHGDISHALFNYWGGKLAGGSYSYPPRVLGSKYFNHGVVK
jgi:soluble lytic murein transglycosylase-like protein